MFEKIRYFFQKISQNQKNIMFSSWKKFNKKIFRKKWFEKLSPIPQPKLGKDPFLYFLDSNEYSPQVSRKKAIFNKKFTLFGNFLSEIYGWLLEKTGFCAFFGTPSSSTKHLKSTPSRTGPGPPKFPAFAVSCEFSVPGGPKPQTPPKKGCIFQKTTFFISFKRGIYGFHKK